MEKIAEYYQFPIAVFLGNEKMFSKEAKTMQESFIKKNKEFVQKVKELMEEYYE